jgi:tetratricopeptide (TPR) repeat protein
MQAISQRQWTGKSALMLVTLCLTVGIAGGWLIRGSQSAVSLQPAIPGKAGSATATPALVVPQSNGTQLKQMADSQAAPLLAKLRTSPKDGDTLIALGNVYYDAQQYPIAIEYYNRALLSRPSDSSVRTDMATAYWYLGNVDQAIAEFNQALVYSPTSPNTLFNLGLVKWQAKHDGAGAIADWQKLLNTNPTYEQKDKVLQMLSEIKKQTRA